MARGLPVGRIASGDIVVSPSARSLCQRYEILLPAFESNSEPKLGPDVRLCDAGVSFDGEEALSSLNLECTHGQFVSIVGPSGCGKSTLLRVIAGLQQLTHGQLTVGATDNDSLTFQWRTGFVFQQPNLLPWRSAIDNIALPLELRGADLDSRLAAAREALTRVGLTDDDQTKLPNMLSGGMRMRVSLARALVTHPQVMLLDEPLAAVDDLLRNQLLVELAALWQQHRWTTILVTHNVAEAVFVSQKVMIMSSRPGRIVNHVDVPLPYPREPYHRSQAQFAELTGQVSEALRTGTT